MACGEPRDERQWLYVFFRGCYCHIENILTTTKREHHMKKVSKGTLIASIIGLVAFVALCCGVTYFVKRLNGTTDAQIEARKRANEAADQTLNAMQEQAQWHQDLMNGSDVDEDKN